MMEAAEENNNHDDNPVGDNNNNNNTIHNNGTASRAARLLRMRSVIQERIRQFQLTITSRRSSSQASSSSSSSSKPESDLSSRPLVFPTLQMVPPPPAQVPQISAEPSISSNDDNVLPFEIPSSNAKSIIEFPNEILYKIFKFLTFDMIGKKRMVCRHFNMICSDILNSEFKCLRNIVQQRLQALKSQMPRRESARRLHPLAREYDIIETVNMRLSLMQTMFSKHIDRTHCAFFAGQVLDEVRRILLYLQTTPVLNFAYKVTDELFDLSTMAVEYFKERIEPTLPDISYIGGFNDYYLFENGSSSPGNNLDLASSSKSFESIPDYCSSSTSSLGSKSSDFSSKSSLNTQDGTFVSTSKSPLSITLTRSATLRIKKLETRNKKTNSTIKTLRCDLRFCKQKLNRSQKQIRKYRSRFEDYDKKLESACSKLSSVLEELSKCKTEIQYLRSSTNNSHESNMAGSSSQVDAQPQVQLAGSNSSAFLTPPSTCSAESTKVSKAISKRKQQTTDKTFKRKLQFVKNDENGESLLNKDGKKQAKLE